MHAASKGSLDVVRYLVAERGAELVAMDTWVGYGYMGWLWIHGLPTKWASLPASA